MRVLRQGSALGRALQPQPGGMAVRQPRGESCEAGRGRHRVLPRATQYDPLAGSGKGTREVRENPRVKEVPRTSLSGGGGGSGQRHAGSGTRRGSPRGSTSPPRQVVLSHHPWRPRRRGGCVGLPPAIHGRECIPAAQGPEGLAIRPMYHWVDSSIRGTCLRALLAFSCRL